jgi:RNA polymerase sigma factor (sigma-70 family)
MSSNPIQSLSAVDLLTRCGNSDEPALWAEFVRRFHRRILLYVLRERRAYGVTTDEANAVGDLAQEVYLRLLSHNRSPLREFRGTTEPAVMSYLACVAHSIVSDHLRHESRQKRAASVVSLDQGLAQGSDNNGLIALANVLPSGEESLPDRMMDERLAHTRLRSILKAALTGANATRDSLVFQMHIISGLSMREISEIKPLKMSLVNVEAVIRRVRERLRSHLNNPANPGLSG